jgi:putative transposase
MVVCDGLKGLPDAVNAVWEKAIVQTCVVHLLRNSFKYASKRDWGQIAKDLKPICTAAPESEALDRFAEFSGKWEKRYPAIIRLWENAWAEFVPFLRFDREIRKVICTTNAIVIWSPRWAVLHVDHEGLRGRVLPGGRGYLPLSITRISRRKHACSAGVDTRLVA